MSDAINEEIEFLKRCPCCNTNDVSEIYCFNDECECSTEQYVNYRIGKANEKLQAECLKYREALEFYANSENYCCTLKVNQQGEPYDDLCPILKDDGSKSREALQSKEGESK
jgi:hypothetical protein